MIKLLLTITSVLVIYFIQKNLYDKYWKEGLSAFINFDVPTCVEGDTITLTQVVSNNKALPVPTLEVKFQTSTSLKFGDIDYLNESDSEYVNNVYSMLFFQKITRQIKVTCKRRGFYSIDNLDLSSSDLLMTTIKSIRTKSDASILVYPAPINIDDILIPYNMVIGNILSKRYSLSDPFEFRGIRDYDVSDTMKSINWKLSAKTGSLKVNLHDYTNNQKIHILLNLESESIWEYELLKEESIKIACSLSNMFIAEGIQTALTSNGCDSATDKYISVPYGSGQAHIDSIATELAKCDYKCKMPDFADILNNLAVDEDHESPYYILISSNKSQRIQNAFARIINDNDYLYIIPYHPEVNDINTPLSLSNTLDWSVPYGC